MDNIKVGDWVVNVSDKDMQLTIGESYKVTGLGYGGVKVIDDVGGKNYIDFLWCKLVPQKYRNPPREEYRELCEAWLAGADINYWSYKLVALEVYNYEIDPNSILPQPDERKERIKKQLLNIDADKLAQLIIDSGLEL
jgi:hypothetical protein